MAVYTPVTLGQASALFSALNLGAVTALQGCASGIENTNYFVTAGAPGQSRHSVLTVFERLSHAQLPFYLRLMKHLAQRGLPVPEPVADAHGNLVHTLQGKPAAIVNRLPGSSVPNPTSAHGAEVGAMLARMHLAGRDFAMRQPNLRGLTWWNETAPVVLPHLNKSQALLLSAELAHQNQLAASPAWLALPRGPIHADLFRDNALFETQGDAPRLSGVFDFYFAGVDAWLFDIAVCLNDWCWNHQAGAPDVDSSSALLHAYAQVRPLCSAERSLLPAMLRAAALRFWLSRLWDFYQPRAASLLQAHNPEPLEVLLRWRAAGQRTLADSVA